VSLPPGNFAKNNLFIQNGQWCFVPGGARLILTGGPGEATHPFVRLPP
jgi:hypothetical protein